MKLTRKFIAALVVGVAIVALIQGFFDYRREREVFDKQMRAEATALGRALARGMAEVWARDGEATAREFLLMASSKSEFIKARWVWLDARTDPPHASREALAPMTQGQPVTIKDRDVELAADVHPGRSAASATDGAERDTRDVVERREGGIEIAQNLADLDKYTTDSLRNQIFGTISRGRRRGDARARARHVVHRSTGVAARGESASGRDRRSRGPVQAAPARRARRARDRDQSDVRSARPRSAARARRRPISCATPIGLTTVGKLASGIAHELGTPLNVVSGRARLIRDGEVDGAEAVDSARIVAEQADRMTAMIRQLLDFARPRALQKAPRQRHEPGGARRRAGRDDREEPRRSRSRRPLHDDALRVEADDGQLNQVLINLVVNAIQATPNGGTVDRSPSKRVEQTAPPYVESAGKQWLAIAIADTGIGMDAETRRRIFEPFFTTKAVGDGTGLGLSVTWGIVREHGGWIDVDSRARQGLDVYGVFAGRCRVKRIRPRSSSSTTRKRWSSSSSSASRSAALSSCRSRTAPMHLPA